jgi:hypothetical protein
MALAPLMMMEAYERMCPTFVGRSDPAVELVARSFWDDAGYCLDAPDEISAGGCYNMEVAEGWAMPEQITFWRDGEQP